VTEPLPKDNGVRRFVVTKVTDGDTIAGRLDLGVGGVELTQSCRLAGINCWEIGTVAGKAAQTHAASLLSLGVSYTVVILGADKYARRFDGVLYLSGGRTLNDRMVLDGYAAPWDGRGSAPLPVWPLPSSGAYYEALQGMAPVWLDDPAEPGRLASTRP
jgi:endonuclease YncB( thermonuclease family)